MQTNLFEQDQSASRLPVVVLTGGIASGKTAVSERFAELGVPVIDTDVIAREVVAPGSEGLAAISAAFGDHVVRADGTLDRAMLRTAIFKDAGTRGRLEAITHPLIVERVRQRLDELAGTGAAYAVVVVPLLVETGLFGEADQVVVVDVPERTQVERLQRRDGIDEIQAKAALAAQAGRSERLERADDVIDNTGTPEALHRQVDALDRAYRKRWGKP